MTTYVAVSSFGTETFRKKHKGMEGLPDRELVKIAKKGNEKAIRILNNRVKQGRHINL